MNALISELIHVEESVTVRNDNKTVKELALTAMAYASSPEVELEMAFN